LISRCDVPFSECITEEHMPDCYCKENFKGNGTESCVPEGFEVEANKVRPTRDHMLILPARIQVPE
jgi:hypothetical protein